MLAFARFPQDSSANVYVMPLAGGEPRQITNERGQLWGLCWTADGKEVVFSSDRSGVSRLWRVPVKSQAGRPPSLVEGAGEDARFPSFSRSGTVTSVRLAYQKFEQNSDIRRAEIVGEGTPQHALKPSSGFLASTKADADPSFSPDGRKIAFVSGRSGDAEIWVSDQDGSDAVALTSMRGRGAAAPQWSPDSRRIAFFALSGALGGYQNHIIDAMGGAPRLLSTGDLHRDFRPSWSGDGRTIYFGSGRSGTTQIWKAPADGGESTQLTKAGGGEPFESPDRDLLYYAKIPSEGPGLWSISVAGGEEVKVLDSPRFGHWAVARKGIYFIDFAVGQDRPKPVKFFKFHDHRVIQIGAVEKSAALNVGGFAVSPDSRWLLYGTLESVEADLMLLENFR
jgi:Tol biopolymer transport system component